MAATVSSAPAFVVLAGPAAGRVSTCELRKGESLVGRSVDGVCPDVDLPADESVGSRHALIVHEGGGFLVEDLGSPRGTSVDGRPIAGCGRVPLSPGAIVRTGDSVWTVVPADWLHATARGVFVWASCLPVVSYALSHSRIPVVGRLTARNFCKVPSPALRVGLEVPGPGEPCECSIPALEPNETVVCDPPRMRFHASALRRQVAAAPAVVRLSVDGALVHERAIQVLGFWDWWHGDDAWKTIAAFVSPRNAVVESLVLDAGCLLGVKPAVSSIAALLQSRRADAERAAMAALYACLATRRELSYVYPRVGRIGEGDGTFQTVRPPHRIFPASTMSPKGAATCLDAALLLAACLERVGLWPLVVLTLDSEGRDAHALVGCWTSASPGAVPVIADLAVLQRHVAEGRLLVLEATGCIRDVPGRSRALGFDEALAEGMRALEAPAGCAVDIGALRPPLGTLNAMESPLEPEVGYAYDAAYAFAAAKRGAAVQTSHLLHGLLAARGEVTRWLCEGAGLDADRLREALDASVQEGRATAPPVLTGGFSECKWQAETYATKAGAGATREQDVWWALLDRVVPGTPLAGTFDRLGVCPTRWRQRLEERYPRAFVAPASDYLHGLPSDR